MDKFTIVLHFECVAPCINALKMTFIHFVWTFAQRCLSLFLSVCFSVQLRCSVLDYFSGLCAFSLNNIASSDVQFHIWSFGWTCQYQCTQRLCIFTYGFFFVVFLLFAKQTKCTKYNHFSLCVSLFLCKFVAILFLRNERIDFQSSLVSIAFLHVAVCFDCFFFLLLSSALFSFVGGCYFLFSSQSLSVLYQCFV